MNRQRSWPGDAGIEYYRLILLHILGRRDEFPEQEHEVDENEKEIFTMPGDAGDERLVLGNDTENHNNSASAPLHRPSSTRTSEHSPVPTAILSAPICPTSSTQFSSVFSLEYSWMSNIVFVN
jgi:hypothetical protein